MTDHTLLPCPFCGGEAEIWRASADPKRPAWVGCMGRCAVLVSREYETTEEAIAAWNRRTPPAAVPDAWSKLLLAAKILYHNAEVCVANHHGRDFKAFGLPGWLADCKRDIENAEASLAGISAAPTPPVDDGAEFKVGDRVRKVTGDYQIEGVVIGTCQTSAGKVRYVVEHTADKGGFLHIYSAQNLRRVSDA